MRKTCSILIGICLMLTSFAPSAFAIDKGDGTEKNPYQIADLEDLKAVTENLSAYYIQTADITITDENTPVADGKKIPVINENFAGHYNGNGKKITFAVTDAPSFYSIFKIIEPTGVVENLYTAGSITSGQSGLAPLVYTNRGAVRNCHNSADITSTVVHATAVRGLIGGIAASLQAGGTIENCTNSGSFSSQDCVGGIVGSIDNYKDTDPDCVIRNCSSTGSMTAREKFAGGIVGAINNVVLTDVEITNCHSKGTVAAKLYAGGIMGGINNSLTGTLRIANCSSSADVSAVGTGADYAGGIFGASASKLADGTINISRCYATGKISATTSAGGIGACFVVANTTKTSVNITGNYFAGSLTGGRIGAMVGTPFVNNRTGTINIAISRNYSTAPGVLKMAGYNSSSTSGTAKWSCPTVSNFILSDGTSALNFASAITAEELSNADTFYAKFDTLSDYFNYDIGDRTDKYPYPQFANNPHSAPGTVLLPVTFTCGENGTISKKDGYVTSGDTVSVEIQPNDGYIISSVLCGEAPAVIQDVNGFTYQTSPLTKGMAIAAAFDLAPEQTPEIVSDVKWNYVPSGETASGNITFGKVTGEEAKITDYGIVYSASNAVPLLDGDDCLPFSAKNYGGKSANGFYGVSLTGSVLDNQLYYTRTYVTYIGQDGLAHTEYGVVITVDLRK